MKRLFARFSSLVLGFFVTLLALPSPAFASLDVFVSIPPQKFFAERIGGERVRVHIMVPPGASPHTYEPRPQQMVSISRADLYFTIGVEFETVWMKKLATANPAMTIVRTQAGIPKIPISGHHDHDRDEHAHEGHDHHDHETHGHDGNGDEENHHDNHAHENGLDPHIWLSPPLVKQQAAAILRALQQADSEGREGYQQRYDRFVREIDTLDQELRALFSEQQETRFLVFHPSWGYFAKAYGLQQIAIESEGKAPKPAQLKRIIETMRELGIRVIFVQPQFSARSAELIARSVDGEVVFVDPLAENWLANMRAVADKFKEALR